MKKIRLLSLHHLCLILFLVAGMTGNLFSQTITVTGEENPRVNTQEYYEAYADYFIHSTSDFRWDIDGGTIVDEGTSPTFWVIVEWGNTPGSGSVTIYDDYFSRTGNLPVSIHEECEPADAGPDQAYCVSGSVTIGTTAIAGYTYSWYPTTGLNNAGIAQPTASPSTTTTYTLTVTPTDNLITNPRFESGATGFSTDLLAYPNELPLGHGHYLVTTNPTNVSGGWCNMGDYSGSGSNMLVVDGELGNYSDHKMWYTTVNVDQNTNYTFSGWVAAASANSEGVNAVVTGNVSGSASVDFSPPQSCGNWYHFTVSWNSGSNTQATLKLTFDYGNSDLAIDDLYFGKCQQTTDQVTVAVSTGTPSVTPAGPITYYYKYEVPSSVLLTSSSSGSYQWYKNNVLIPGATNQTYLMVTDAPNSSTDYYKCVNTCGTSNIVTFNYVACDDASDYPVTIPYAGTICLSNFPVTLTAPSLGTGTTYNWSTANNPCYSLSNFSGNTCQLNTTGSCINYSEEIYSKSSKAGEEIYMYFGIQGNQGCRQMNLGNNSLTNLIDKIHEQKLNTHIIENENSKTIKLFPNPANTQVTIIAQSGIDYVEIINMAGMILKQTKTNESNSLSISVRMLPPGIYSCKVITKTGIKYLKLLIQR